MVHAPVVSVGWRSVPTDGESPGSGGSVITAGPNGGRWVLSRSTVHIGPHSLMDVWGSSVGFGDLPLSSSLAGSRGWDMRAASEVPGR